MIRREFTPINLDFEIERNRFKINNKHDVSEIDEVSYEPRLGIFLGS
jgi:hypothetical protein